MTKSPVPPRIERLLVTPGAPLSSSELPRVSVVIPAPVLPRGEVGRGKPMAFGAVYSSLLAVALVSSGPESLSWSSS